MKTGDKVYISVGDEKIGETTIQDVPDIPSYINVLGYEFEEPKTYPITMNIGGKEIGKYYDLDSLCKAMYKHIMNQTP